MELADVLDSKSSLRKEVRVQLPPPAFYIKRGTRDLLKLGVHVSIAGKIYKSIDRAVELGCNTMQIFSRNPRQWRKSLLSDEDVERFKRGVKKSKISPVVIHIPYLLNLATVRKSFFKIYLKN